MLAVVGNMLGVDKDEVEICTPGHADPQGGGRRDQRAVDAVANAEGLTDFVNIHDGNSYSIKALGWRVWATSRSGG